MLDLSHFHCLVVKKCGVKRWKERVCTAREKIIYVCGKVMVKEIRTGMVPFHRKEGICAKLKILE